MVVQLKIVTKCLRCNLPEGDKCRICRSFKTTVKKHLGQKIFAPLDFAFFNKTLMPKHVFTLFP